MNLYKLTTPILAMLLASCAGQPNMYLDSQPVATGEEARPIDESSYTLEQITPELVARLENEFTKFRGGKDVEYNKYQYRVGPRDVLSIIIYDHPELTIPAGEFRSADAAGNKVDARGYIFYPFVGEIKVAGLTVGEIRRKLADALKTHIPDPQVDVRVASFNSEKVTVTGEVAKPGRLPITDEALTVIRAISLSGGPRSNGDLTSVRVVREGKNYQIDVESYLQLGDLSQNMLLRGDDVIHVPDQTANQIYLMGELRSPKSIPMKKRRMTLAQAIGNAGSTGRDSDIRKVFVIRGAGETEQVKLNVYHVNLKTVEGMVLAGRFPMKPRDVVYVSTSELAKFNRLLNNILPYVRAVQLIDDLAYDLGN